MVEQGDNRYHAILGNHGPAKFVSASRLAPALIALGATARVIGPDDADEAIVPVEQLFRVPRHEGERETTLRPGQLVTHLLLPPADGVANATYEVRHGEGPDIHRRGCRGRAHRSGVVQDAIVLGHVAPPWIGEPAATVLRGWPVTPNG
jgi:xanthine dehydrogenase YagS FAD-binding subunit